MKAVSIRQPWAELILQGRKTIEVRTWTMRTPAQILIHAAKAVDEDAVAAHRLNAGDLPRGAIVGTVKVEGMVPFDSESWESRKHEHLANSAFDPRYVGWRLSDPIRWSEPVTWRGSLGLFDVPDEWVAQQIDQRSSQP